MCFNALLTGSDSLPRLFLFPDESETATETKLRNHLGTAMVGFQSDMVAGQTESIPSIDAFPGTTPVLLTMAKALYAHARTVFSEDGVGEEHAVRALTAVSEESCDAAVRIACAMVSTKFAAVEGRELGRLLWIRDEFARLREGKLWKLREGISRLSRRLRGR
jgi:hypothetical protein